MYSTLQNIYGIEMNALKKIMVKYLLERRAQKHHNTMLIYKARAMN